MVFRAIVALVCLVLIPVYGYSGWTELSRLQDPLAGQVFWFVVGALVAWTAYLWRSVSVLRVVLLHELSHAIVGKLLGARVGEIGASAMQGGVTRFQYGYRNGTEFIALAPYYLQVVPLTLLAVKAIAIEPLQPVLAAAIGFAWWGFHCDLWLTLRAPQADITESGRLFSWAVIVTANILISGVVVTGAMPELSSERFLWTGAPSELWELLIAWIQATSGGHG